MQHLVVGELYKIIVPCNSYIFEEPNKNDWPANLTDLNFVLSQIKIPQYKHVLENSILLFLKYHNTSYVFLYDNTKIRFDPNQIHFSCLQLVE